MSAFKEALDRIRHWFQENHPAAIASLASGLSSLEIDAALSTLPFQVSKEVRELHERSNGYPKDARYDERTWIWDYRPLLSLNSAVQEAQTWVEEPDEEITVKYIGKPVFPRDRRKDNISFELDGRLLPSKLPSKQQS